MNITFSVLLSAAMLFTYCKEPAKTTSTSITLISDTNIDLSKAAAEDGIVFFGIDSTKIDLVFKPDKTYQFAKEMAVKTRSQLSTFEIELINLEQLDSVGSVFTEMILNNIIPHWYGTPWDFEGHTSVPQQGEIACGYFVSTTLNHMGINVNRYKLAQQGPKNEAISISIDSQLVRTISDQNIEADLKQLKNGLYFIGLDNHVGYLLKRKGVTYFLHSNYIENKVMIEKVNDSQAFYSTTYYLADITHNRKLMHKWLSKSEIHVFTE